MRIPTFQWVKRHTNGKVGGLDLPRFYGSQKLYITMFGKKLYITIHPQLPTNRDQNLYKALAFGIIEVKVNFCPLK